MPDTARSHVQDTKQTWEFMGIFSGCHDMEKFGKHCHRVIEVEVKLQFRRAKWRNRGGGCERREFFPDIQVSE